MASVVRPNYVLEGRARKDVCMKMGNHLKGEMRSVYDFATISCAIRGKYVKRLRRGEIIVVLEPEVATTFPTAGSVNAAL